MDKLDLTRDKAYYAPPSRPVEASFGPLPYLKINGRGAPEGPAYIEALEALYPLAYAVKFASKAADRDFTVSKLEGQWWWPDEYGKASPDTVPREVWEWTLRIRLPDFIDAAAVETARPRVKKPLLARLADVQFEVWDEGPCVQILHVGPYSTEPETLKLVHAYLEEHRLVEHGRHHEIYLSDPRKGDPARRKTVLRVPVKPASINSSSNSR